MPNETPLEIPGVDYAWSHPGGAALKAAGKKFACRYLSNGASKNISRPEADDLAAHGVSTVVVWESTAQRPLAGRAAGITDATTAAKQAAAAGMPTGRPIYFAVDFDATKTQMPTVMAYLDGAASVLGTNRTGVYGGYDTVRAALDGGHVAWAWQTRAWSEGRWDSRAVIRQGATKTIGGVSCDLNTALAADYGQWMPGVTPDFDVLEDDMAISSDDARTIGRQVVTGANGMTGPGTTKEWAVSAYLAALHRQGAALTAQVAALTATVGALAQGGGLTAAEITAAAEAGAQAALDRLGDALTPDTPTAD